MKDTDTIILEEVYDKVCKNNSVLMRILKKVAAGQMTIEEAETQIKKLGASGVYAGGT